MYSPLSTYVRLSTRKSYEWLLMKFLSDSIMVVLIIFPVILQTVINFKMLSIGGWGRGRGTWSSDEVCVTDVRT